MQAVFLDVWNYKFEVWEQCKFIGILNKYYGKFAGGNVWEQCKFIGILNLAWKGVSTIAVWEQCKFIGILN